MSTHPTDDVSLTSRRHTHKAFKANKTFIVQVFFFSIFFSFLQKHAHIHKVWQVLGRHTRTHSGTHTRTHIRTNTLSWPRAWTAKALKTSGVASPLPRLSTPLPYPASVKLVLCGAAVRAEVGETPETEGTLTLGAVARHPWDCVVLLRGDEGLAPLGQEAQDSESTCLLHQGTEMVHVGWPLAGQ